MITIERDERESAAQRFDRIVAPLEHRVRRALVARYGVEIGDDAAAETIAWAWEHLDRLDSLSNPAGYLFRVGQSAARRLRRWPTPAPFVTTSPTAVSQNSERVDEALVGAMNKVSARQRTAVLLVHGYGFSYREVADVLAISEAAVTNHVHRGLARLRSLLEVDDGDG